MNSSKTLVCIALALSLLLVASMAYARPAGKSAFLSEYAENTDQVVAQMEANRLVALRYARVFVSEPKAVLTYFRNELSLVTLDSSMDMTVYRLDDEGRIVSETVTLKAGTKIFANRAGYPVLEYGTGNPLTSKLPAPDQALPKSNPVTQANNNAPQTPKPNPLANNKPVVGQNTPPPAPNTPVVPTEPGSTVVGGTSPALPPVTEPTTKVAGVQMSTGGGAGIGSWMLPVGLAGAVAALAGGGGGGTTGGGGTIPTGDDTGGGGDNGGGDPPTVVPEPASLLALGTGLMALGGLIGRRRRH